MEQIWKRSKILILFVLFLVFSGCSVIENIDSSDYVRVMESTWKIQLPKGYTEIINANSGASFHGDGIRYYVLQYETLEEIKNAFTWTVHSRKTNDYESYEEAIEEWLNRCNMEEIDKPDLKKVQYYYTTRYDKSELLFALEIEEQRLYIFENLY